MCKSGEVEDEEHFIDKCERLEEERREMWKEVYSMLHGGMKYRVMGMDSVDRVDWILGSEWRLGAWKWDALQKTVIKGLGKMFAARRRGMRD